MSEVFFIREKFINKYAVKQKIYDYVVYAGLEDDKDNIFMRMNNSLNLEERIDFNKLAEAAKEFLGKHNFKQFTSKHLHHSQEGYTFIRIINDIECKESIVELFDRQVQKITLRYKAKGFLQYQVRMMSGILLQIAKGESTVETLKKLLDDFDGDHSEIPRSVAPAHGLTLIDVLYKDNHLFKVPQDISEEYFMRGHKRRLEKLGITYEVPDPNQEHDFGSLFD